jgi:XTP/dITP diphosphohydrolase
VKLYCASSNPGKLREFSLAAGRDWELVPLAGIPPCEETGDTFEENAILKAVHYSRHAPGLLFAEDSGLELNALGGAPGVRSARFAKQGVRSQESGVRIKLAPARRPGASVTDVVFGDADNNRLLIEKLRGVSDRSARYVCVIAIAEAGNVLQTFRGEVAGKIVDEPRGTNGFGYDPYFYYPPLDLTFAQAAAEQKLRVSHRGRALAKMLEWLSGRK